MQKIREQTIREIEVIILDSMSTDESKEIAKQFGATIIEVPDGTFNHGLTRNIGVENAAGDLIFLTVQDAWIAENNMLEKMAEHFEDNEVMGVTGHQAIPHEKDKNPLLWYRPYSENEVTERSILDKATFESLPVNKQQALIAWDNVVAMYRRTALIEQPFLRTEMAEDWIWSYQALLKGWRLLRDSSLVVHHYHHQSYRYAFRLTYSVNYHFHKFFNWSPSLPPTFTPIMKATFHLLKSKKLSARGKLYWIYHNGTGKIANLFSTINFLSRLKTGGQQSVAKGYNKYCKKVPQGEMKK